LTFLWGKLLSAFPDFLRKRAQFNGGATDDAQVVWTGDLGVILREFFSGAEGDWAGATAREQVVRAQGSADV
jgi:hypothetical protein